MYKMAVPHSSVGSFADLRTGGRWFDPRLGQYSFQGLMIVMRQDSFLSHHCPLFLQWLCGKAASGLEEYCAKYWLKELQESMDTCTGHRDITEIHL